MLASRSHITLRILAALLAFVLVVSGVSATPVAAFADDSTTTDVSLNVTYMQTEARTITDMVNTFRTDEDDAWYWGDVAPMRPISCSNLSALTYDYTLEKIAMQRAAEIVLSFSHARPDGTSYDTAFNGYSGYTAIGENIAADMSTGMNTAEKAFAYWRADNAYYVGQEYRRNMLSSDCNAIGIACVYVNNT